MIRLLHQVPVLRVPVFSDKEESGIRVALTLFLFFGILLCFAALVIFKWENRSILQTTIYNPSYSTFLSLNQSHELTCGITNTNIHYQYINNSDSLQGITITRNSWSFNSSFLNNPCRSAQAVQDVNQGTGFFYYSCFYSYYSCGTLWLDGGIQQSSLLSPAAITDSFASTAQTQLALFGNVVVEMMLNIVDFEAFSLKYSLINGNVDNFNNFITALNGGNFTTLPQTTKSQLSVVATMLATSRVDCANSFTVDYSKYYELSRVNQCTYFQLQGLFEVFSFALTTTASLVALVVFVVKAIYQLIATRQAKKKPEERRLETISRTTNGTNSESV